MNASLSDPAFWSRFQFGFTLIYHYLFPQLTMGLGWFLVYWKWRALKTGDEKYNRAVRFWAKIFGLNFAVGVVTGIPMEFQFGTNWASFSRYAGGTIGQTLAMEGMFAFFLESAFVGALIWGEKRLGPRYHFMAAVAVALGSWLSGYFILVTNAFMQHPVGYQVDSRGSLGIGSFSAYLLNPWALIQFSHNQIAALVTGSFVVTSIGAFYALRQLHPVQAQLYLRAGTWTGLIASLLVAFPTGDQQAKMVGRHQPVTLAAMEGKFVGGPDAGVAVIGQPNVAARRLDNPIEMPGALSFLAYGHFGSYVHGLDEFPTNVWPDNIETSLLFISLDDHSGHDFHRAYGLCQVRRLARPIGIQHLAPVGFDAGASLPLHCQYSWMDDGRTGASTLAGLWPFSHQRRLQQSGERRGHRLHLNWLRRPLLCVGSALSISGRS